MTGEILFVFVLLAVTILLFVSDKLRLDMVALLVVLTLILSGILSPREALSGFGDPLVIMIGGLFVVGDGLFRTGVAHSMGNWVLGVSGTGEVRLQIMLMLVVAFLSAFMSSTGAVAILIPVALNLAAKANISPSRLMIPMSFASLMGGMLTLIGTPPNLVVSTQLESEGLAPFGFFHFTPIGLLVLLTGIAYMTLLGRHLLPDRVEAGSPSPNRLSLMDLVETYGITQRLHRLRIRQGSGLHKKTVGASMLRSRYGVTVLGIEKSQPMNRTFEPVGTRTEFSEKDILYVVGSRKDVDAMAFQEGLDLLQLDEGEAKTAAQELGMVEVLLSPRSELIGQTLSMARFRDKYDLTVLGVLRKGKPLTEDVAETPLSFGDSLLVGGSWRQIELFQEAQNDFLVMNLPKEGSEGVHNRPKAPRAVAVVILMLFLMTFELVPNVAAVLIAAIAMVLSGCTNMKQAYQSMNWQSLVLIAGMLPMAEALEKTGGVELIVNGLVAGIGDYGPYAIMAGLFIITSFFSLFISNTATTVLITPIAMGTAWQMGVSPYTFLMTVAISASAAFSTPVSSPVNTLVLGPGGYRFNDFLKVGVPLQLAAMVVTLVAVPILFRLHAGSG